MCHGLLPSSLALLLYVIAMIIEFLLSQVVVGVSQFESQPISHDGAKISSACLLRPGGFMDGYQSNWSGWKPFSPSSPAARSNLRHQNSCHDSGGCASCHFNYLGNYPATTSRSKTCIDKISQSACHWVLL